MTLTSALFKRRRNVSAVGVSISLAAIFIVVAVCALVLHVRGTSLAEFFGAFADGAFGSGYAIADVVNRSIDYALVGLGFLVAARAGLTNVGAEGQIAVGGIAATSVALYGHVAVLPASLAVLLPTLAAAAAGSLWGGVAGVLKVRVGTNEVISTLLLGFIGVWLVYGCVQAPSLLRQPITADSSLPELPEIPDATKFTPISANWEIPLTWMLPIALLLACATWILLSRSWLGWRLRAVGLNPVAARRAGISPGETMVLAMAISGAFGGLAGANMLQGGRYVLDADFSSGYGFDGLVVGLLGRGSVPGVLLAAAAFGALRSGGINVELVTHVPSAIVQVVQGLIVVALPAMQGLSAARTK